MDKLSAKFKQKKRKTRKCLNEIRRRSLHTMNQPFSRLLEGRKICITEERLTLAMFPKVVRSETVTRPALLKADNPAQTKSEGFDENSKRAELSLIQLNTSESSDSNKHSEEKVDISTDNEMLRSQNGSSVSLILLSPCSKPDNADVHEAPLDATFMTSSPSSQNSEDSRLHFYEEFIKEIPLYLRQHSPALIKDDVMKKTRKALHDIRLEVPPKDSDTINLQCINSQKRKNKIAKVPIPTVYTEEYVQPDTLTQLKFRPVLRHLSMQDTPEYSYYPHKLNQ